MKKFAGILMISIMLTFLVGCPVAKQPSVNNLLVMVTLQDEGGDDIFSDYVDNFEVLTVEMDSPISGQIYYDGDIISKVGINLSIAGETVSLEIGASTKTFEPTDLLWLIAAGILVSAQDVSLEQGHDAQGDWSTFNFNTSSGVDSMSVIATTSNGSVFITYFNREGQDAEVDYTLTTSVQGQGSVTGAGTYTAGTTVTISATPASGWTFDHWTVNGTMANNNPGQITMDSDVTVVAVFTQNAPTNYTLSITTQGQGTTTGAGSYAIGTQVTITATPASGWVFDHWTVNGTTAMNNPGAVMMNSDVAVVAVFTSDANPGGLIKVNLTWNDSTLSLSANNANPGSIGLELYHQSGGTPWIERQVFTVNNGNASGTISKFRPNILRFGVVSNATSGGYIPLETMTVKINGQNVPLVNSAYQVDVSTL